MSIIALKKGDYDNCVRLCDLALNKMDRWLKNVNYS